MDDWEKDDFEPAAPALHKDKLKTQWDDEDVEEDDVKESWEDEDEAPKPEPPVEKVNNSKSTGKAAAKTKTDDSKKTPLKVSVEDSNAPTDPIEEKLRRQRMEEESDYKSTRELFAKKGGDDKTLDSFIPKSENDFLEYAELISHKLLPYEKSFYYISLLKATMRLSLTSLKAADVKELASSISAIANEKLKAEKEANVGKKKGTKKKQLHIEPDEDAAVVGGYEALDDYDFM